MRQVRRDGCKAPHPTCEIARGEPVAVVLVAAAAASELMCFVCGHCGHAVHNPLGLGAGACPSDFA